MTAPIRVGDLYVDRDGVPVRVTSVDLGGVWYTAEDPSIMGSFKGVNTADEFWNRYRRAGEPSRAGCKYDNEKPRWATLVPWKQLFRVVDVLEYGAKKYSPDNWKRVENGKERYLNAAMRHLVARCSGEINDPESGLPHLACCACSCLFGIYFDEAE